MKYIIILAFVLAGCSIKPPMPKAGECFEHYFKEYPLLTYEFRKIIKINTDGIYDTIEYVYNFKNEDSFKKGKWYINPTTTTSKRMFFGTDRTVINKIKCPWQKEKK